MSVEDDLKQGFLSSITSNNYSNITDLSPEDAAWVDSCLVKDPELSESSWNAVKEALLDIICSETHSNFSTSVGENGSFKTSSSSDVPMSEMEMTQGNTAAKYGSDAAKADKEEMDLIRNFLLKDMSEFCGPQEGETAEVGFALSDENYMDALMGKEAGKSHCHVSGDDHKPFKDFKDLEFLGGDVDGKEASVTEKEEMGLFRGFLLKDKSKIREGVKEDNKFEEVDLEMNQTDEIDQLHDDIFKVWDLETPVEEEDELVKQLEKALTESSLTTQPLADSIRSDFNVGALDSLISGISDLSLDPISGSE